MRPRRIFWFLLLAVPLCAVTIALRPQAEGADAGRSEVGEQALPVRTQPARREAGYEVRDMLVGTVVSPNRGRLGFLYAGTLEWVAPLGHRFEADAVLARLDTQELRARRSWAIAVLQGSEARARALEARVGLARRTLERQSALLESQLLSPARHDAFASELDALRAERLAAVNTIDAGRAELRQIDVQLSQSGLSAPFAGMVVERSAGIGSLVAPGATVLEVVGTADLEVHVGVSARLAAELREGDRHWCEIGGTPHELRLRSVLAELDADTRTYRAIFEPITTLESRSGALARVRFASRVETPGLWVPTTAMTEGARGLWNVYVVETGENGATRAATRQIEVLHSDGDRAFVRGTLQEGERVITRGIGRVVPGQLVAETGS